MGMRPRVESLCKKTCCGIGTFCVLRVCVESKAILYNIIGLYMAKL